MKNERIIEMIDEHLTEPHSLGAEWVEALTICKQALKDNEKKDIEINILIRKNETLKDEVERLRIRNDELNALNKSASIEGMKMFVEMLKQKKAFKGSRVIYIDRIIETLKELTE